MPSTTLERRFLEGVRLDGRTLRGTAMKYGDQARIQVGTTECQEQFAPGSFGNVDHLDTTLDVLHRPDRRLVRTGGAGLTFTDDGTELRLEAVLPQTRDGDDAIEMVRSGLLRGLSIEFYAYEDQWAGSLRTVTRAALPSVGLVDKPAYLGSLGIELRRLDTGGVQLPPGAGGRRDGAILGDSFPLVAVETPKRRRGLLLWL